MMLTNTGPVTMIAAVGDLAAVGLAVAAGEGIDGMKMVGVATAVALGGAVAARARSWHGWRHGAVRNHGVAVTSPVEIAPPRSCR
ncbi:MAG: hypothetical protein U0841_29780 [Chloroflexia bacterium]